ncbi:MAG: hypothetical protein LBP67_05250 [Bacteroidales bacterium]|jgi:hypothetical protein|nr:hypothetical protein [Bacteroidales bacterium]
MQQNTLQPNTALFLAMLKYNDFKMHEELKTAVLKAKANGEKTVIFDADVCNKTMEDFKDYVLTKIQSATKELESTMKDIEGLEIKII